MARIDVLLGGRVAEEIVFGDVSTGASDDLRRATELARHMITEYGMGEALGLVAYPQSGGSVFLDLPGLGAGTPYGPDTARRVDEEVRVILDESRDRVRAMLQQLRGAVEELARMLMEVEVVDGAAVVRLAEERPEFNEVEARDPVCRMTVPRPSPQLRVTHGGGDRYFCSAECRDAFVRDPHRYTDG